MPLVRSSPTLAIAVCLVLAAAGACMAQEGAAPPSAPSSANAGATPIRGEAVFRAFHGEAGIARIVDDLVERDGRDRRIADIFATTDRPHLKRMLREQFCYILGGGCVYTGLDMAAAHRGQGLQASDFNALVENLQAAMDHEHVPFWAQNRLLAKLAPMERVVVERKSPVVLHHLARRLAAALHSGN